MPICGNNDGSRQRPEPSHPASNPHQRQRRPACRTTAAPWPPSTSAGGMASPEPIGALEDWRIATAGCSKARWCALPHSDGGARDLPRREPSEAGAILPGKQSPPVPETPGPPHQRRALALIHQRRGIASPEPIGVQWGILTRKQGLKLNRKTLWGLWGLLWGVPACGALLPFVALLPIY